MAGVGDSPYEAAPHAARSTRLRRDDRSRYGQVRLTITRSPKGPAIVSVIVRSVSGGMLRDSRLRGTLMDLAPGSAASVDPLAALEAALDLLRAEQG